MESEASELPKSLVLDGGGHIHIRHIIPFSPLVDVGCYNPPTLGARHPRWHTRTTWQSDSDTILSHPRSAPLNFPVGHPSWDYYSLNSLNFRVPMESEASEHPKGLVLDGDRHVHIRHITPSLRWSSKTTFSIYTKAKDANL
ncbi:unnamed protein product [Prunus armeniaca]